jgi:hypothetical protein
MRDPTELKWLPMNQKSKFWMNEVSAVWIGRPRIIDKEGYV